MNFETNDFAQLTGADGLLMAGNIRYRETQPGRLFRNYYVQFDVSNDATLRMLRQDGRLRGTVNVTFANFWTAQVQVARVPELTSISLTRGGPLMQRGPGWNTQINVGNRAAAQTRLTATAILANNDSGLSQARVTGTVSFRPAPRWQLSAEPLYEQVTEPQQYVTTLANGRPETYGFRYVFGFIDRTTVSTRFRMGYTVKPDMNLDVYAEPFAASGHYYDYGELLAPRSRERLLYGTSGTTLVVNADGSQTVTADGSTFTLPKQGLQQPLLPIERRAALGVEARQHVVRGVAAEPVQYRGDRRSRGHPRHVPIGHGAGTEPVRHQDDLLDSGALAGTGRVPTGAYGAYGCL